MKTGDGKLKHVATIILLVLAGLLAVPAGSGAESYQIGPGDLLNVTVLDHPEISSTLRVDDLGHIQLQLIGLVKVEGLTPHQVSERLTGLFADGYLVNPQVLVRVEEYRSRKVVVVGQVGRPGMYELSGPTTLLELISKVGGLTKDAGDKITINRKLGSVDGQPGEEVVEVNIRRLIEEGDTSSDVMLRDGDSVFVPKANIAYVTGEVKRPDSYKIEQGETVIMLITKAGGFTQLAAQGRVRIIRKVNGEEKVLERVPLNLPVSSDDVIVVPESFF